MRVPVIIPFYRNQDQLDNCLLHLRKQTVPVQTFIYDNSQENIYFTRAINAGLRFFLERVPQQPYIVILNQDMYLQPDAVEVMVEFMDSTPGCGIGMPLQISEDDPNEVIFGGGVGAYPIGTAGVGPLASFARNQQLRWAAACCWIMRVAMIREIGLLDENMQLVGSDSDYCFTARSRGFQVWNIVKARGVHEGGASKCHTEPDIYARKVLDMDYYACKWITGELYSRLSHPTVPSSREELVGDIESIRNEAIRIQDGMDT